MMEFQPFSKIARLSREMIVTEKIDGTNAQIMIASLEEHPATVPPTLAMKDGLGLWAGSRTRWITPTDDNFGFARWATENADALFTLGPGRHFGEWWGSGIQRGYGLPKGEKRFSLFNTTRWALHGTEPGIIPSGDPRPEMQKRQDVLPPCVGLVPVLYTGPFSTEVVGTLVERLRTLGSAAAPGFMKPEGVVVFHTASGFMFKKTVEKDDQRKGASQ